MTNLNYLIVLLEYDSVPFCLYEVPQKNGGSDRISREDLENAVQFAVRNNLAINFIYGYQPLSPEFDEIIAAAEHVKIMPMQVCASYENPVIVIDPKRDMDNIGILAHKDLNNLIMRIGKEDLASLGALTQRLAGNFKRLNIILKDPANFKNGDFQLYAKQLDAIREILTGEYRRRNFIEINVITDRIFLTNMNNCDAGTRHLTCGPNGRFYICPAFYYLDPGSHIGEINTRIDIKNSRLFELRYAPICRRCDAWHCKRCVYLNMSLTTEINTPSHEQCVLSHIEREASRKFLRDINHGNGRLGRIPKLKHRDPFERIAGRSGDDTQKDTYFADILSKPLINVSKRDLVRQIYNLDPEMIIRLKEMNCSPVDLTGERLEPLPTDSIHES